MGKPFKLNDEGTTEAATALSGPVAQANVGRGVDGKFAKLEGASPGDLADEAKALGVDLQEAARANRVPDKEVGSDTPRMSGGDAVYEDAIPWPEAGPYNDADRPPMKLRG